MRGYARAHRDGKCELPSCDAAGTLRLGNTQLPFGGSMLWSHLLAYFFLPLTRTFLRWSELRVHDGCASVEAAFRVSELELLARSLAPARVVVQRHVPWFRVSMILEGVNTFQSHGLFVRSAGLVCSEARPRASGSSHAFYTAALWERRFDASASHFGRCDINHSNRYQMDRRVNHFHSNLRADCSWVGIQLRAHH